MQVFCVLYLLTNYGFTIMNYSNLINNAQAIMNSNVTTNTTKTEETTMTNFTMKVLIAMYNEKADKPRKSFKNKADAIAAIEALSTTTTIETTKEEETQMNTTQADTTELAPINENALSSTIAAKVFLLLGDAQQATVIACAVTDAVSLVRSTGMDDGFLEFTVEAAETAKLSTVHVEPGPLAKQLTENKQASKEAGEYYIPTKEEVDAVRKEKGTRTETSYDVVVNEELITKTLGKLKMVNMDGTMGNVLVEMIEQRKEAYAPTKVGETFERKFKLVGLEKGQLKQASDLPMEAILAQEASQFSTDKYILDLVNIVQPKLDKLGFADKESYVVAGCNAMDSNLPYTSEFKFDNRLRSYQAACHGPNGQSSDRSRALMNLHGVTTDYNVKQVTKVIMAEVADMCSVEGAELQEYLDTAVSNPVEFAVELLQMLKSNRPVQKVWSFIKAAKILAELAAGNKPYIGMAVGLDAKCSGPQYGALMAGDDAVSAACGFTLEKGLEDAYQRCIAILEQDGEFMGMSRNGIKKTFMGVFYGQGYAAFQDIAQLRKDEQFELVEVLLDGNTYVSEERAKKFHKLVTSSFGKKMVYIRNQVAKFNNNVEGRMGHFMPTGAKVQMNYKVKENILGQVVEMDTICPDVLVSINGSEFKFINMALKTKEVDSNNFVRTAFVNMIQAVDALIAQLIVVHLKRLGAQHIVAVHDCFRVNVTEMHLLEQAIKLAYTDVFGSQRDQFTKDLPMGGDILGMFFAGLEAAKAVDSEAKTEAVSQFTKSGIRRFQKCGGEYVHVLINRLGETYYFAK